MEKDKEPPAQKSEIDLGKKTSDEMASSNEINKVENKKNNIEINNNTENRSTISKEEEKGSKENESEKKKNNEDMKRIHELELKVGSLWASVRFTFPQPRVVFGKGVVDLLPDAIHELLTPTLPQIQQPNLKHPKIMLVIGGHSMEDAGILGRIKDNLEKVEFPYLIFHAGSGEPTLNRIDEGVKKVLEWKPDFIVGIGGGSVLDTAKAMAGIATNGGHALDYHEGKTFEKPGIPFIAIPTTAGTGSEITSNSVLIDPEHERKKSIRSPLLVAKYILLDPELTLTCPPKITANSGADALVQAIEAYTSKNSHPLADIYAMEAIAMLSHNLRRAYQNGNDFDARAEMLLGSYFAGIAFSNVGLGLVHGLAHPIGFKYKLPHGLCCGALLPHVIEYNMEVRAKKYARIARFLNDLDLFSKYDPAADDLENTRKLIGMIKEVLAEIKIPLRLRDLGVKKEDFDWIVENTKGGSVNANPRKVDPESLKKLLEKAW